MEAPLNSVFSVALANAPTSLVGILVPIIFVILFAGIIGGAYVYIRKRWVASSE